MIKLNNIRKKYMNKDKASFILNNINIELPSFGFYSLIGKSGSGKSTILSIIGLLENYDGGEYIFNDINLNNLNDSDKEYIRNQYIGYVFQDYNVIPDFTIRENLELSFKLQNKPIDNEFIDEILTKLDLLSLEDNLACDLSGGEKQRVAIARALCKKPLLLLCDEPTGALDVYNSNNILQILKELSNDILVFMVTHDTRSAKKYCDKIFNIDALKKEVVVENTINENRDLNKTNIALDFKTTLSLSKRMFKKKRGRLSLSIVSTTLILSLFNFLAGIGFNNKYKTVCKSIKELNVKTMVYRIHPPHSEYESKFVGNDIYYEKISNEIGYMTPIYKNFMGNDLPNLSHGSDFDEEDTIYGSVILNEELINEYGYTLYGNYPQEKNEVVITDYMYELYQSEGYIYNNFLTDINSKDDIIDKSLYFDYFDNQKYELKIVGILDTFYNKDSILSKDYYSNCNKDIKKSNRRENFSYSPHLFLYLNEVALNINDDYEGINLWDYYNESNNCFGLMLNYSSYDFNRLNSISNKNNIRIYSPKSSYSINDIFIPLNHYSYYGSESIENMVNYFINDYVSNHLTEIRYKMNMKYGSYDKDKYIDLLKENDYEDIVLGKSKYDFFDECCKYYYDDIDTDEDWVLIYGNRAIEIGSYHVAGLYYSSDDCMQENDEYLLFNSLKSIKNNLQLDKSRYIGFMTPFYNNISKNVKILKYLKAMENENSNVQIENKSFCFSTSNASINNYNNSIGAFDYYFELFCYASLFFIFLIFIFMYFYIKGIIQENKKEIGVLTAIGMRKKDTIKSYIITTVFIGLISFFVSIVLSIGAIIGVNQWLISKGALINYFIFSPLALIIDLIIVIGLGILIAEIMLRKLFKKSISSIIRDC